MNKLLIAFLSMLVSLAAQSELLVSGLEGASGSAVGPDGALYVTEGAAGRVSRVDPWTGETTTFASGLPPALIGIGGAVDVAFIDGVAYVLVTLVSPDLNEVFGPIGADGIDGIYRIDGPDSFTLIADIGSFALDNPPVPDFFIPSGVLYAMEPFRGGFLVTDGHHNRVYRVTLKGKVSELIAFDNIVPTGLELHGNTIYMSQAGPAPHLPEDGKVVAFGPKSSSATDVAAGGMLMVDVEFGRGRKLYALAQGMWDGAFPGSPALPFTGSLFEVAQDGTLTELATQLNQPTSMEFIGNTAFIVTLGGEIHTISAVSKPPFGTQAH